MRYIKISILVLAVVVPAACVDNTGPYDPGPPTDRVAAYCCESNHAQILDTFSIVSIESTIALDFGKQPSSCCESEKNNWILTQRTDYIYWGFNFSVMVTVETSPGVIEFNHWGIQIPIIVADALGPATTFSYFEIPDGVYELVFNYLNMRDVYRLTVKGDSFEIVPVTTEYTRLDLD